MNAFIWFNLNVRICPFDIAMDHGTIVYLGESLPTAVKGNELLSLAGDQICRLISPLLGRAIMALDISSDFSAFQQTQRLHPG